ncbi:N-acetylhexosamine 1-kinase [Halomicronema hongdechloris C2206]|uniref:N-acetylhexosamine 1-kinase n=1 Tax=Halomicronema hongdechloris C2206 TaxID=1641165 RepID=A0A1Z3HUH2_9CYAN|nr:phosphotransferase [Halomicronema hongdechloris]ASC73777.1 N-acetylhexosamine 1-kinase [Halomicronema hongdechloris C2206]
MSSQRPGSLVTSRQNQSAILAIAQRFAQGPVTHLAPLGHGNINHTFLVQVHRGQPFVLQRLNPRVFPHPQQVISNLRTVNEHGQQRLQHASLPRRWELPQLLPTDAGDDYWIDDTGVLWRALSFVANTQVVETLQDDHQAKEVGYALGLFHWLLSDLSPHRLADTLEGFHITPGYLAHYEQVQATTTVPNSPEVAYCRQCICDRTALVPVLETAKARGQLPLRLMHGDPKVNNVLFDNQTDQAVSLIDLDTVKPGLVQYDIGDCLRSGCNPAGEETEQLDTVDFDLDRCQALLQGYCTAAHAYLTPADYHYIYDATRLIAFELGLRFFTDYLAGNVYFRASHPDHNLMRALVQFRLTERIEAQAAAMQQLIGELLRSP